MRCVITILLTLSIVFATLPLALSDLPSIVMVLMDDVGWGDVGYNAKKELQYQPGAGGENWVPNPPRTPNLDAMSQGNNTLVFLRAYSGSPVCSPTRSSILSGRTPNRECITGAEGCGQLPAWKCADNLPYPPSTFTVAEAAKTAGLSTFFAGKWHVRMILFF